MGTLLRDDMVQTNKAINNGLWHINLQEFVCGWGASFINISVTYPVYKIMFRQMLHGVEIKSAVQELRHEGFAFLYRGILPPLAQRTASLSLMFGLYDGTKRPLVKLGLNEYLAKGIAGITAGTVEAILMPFERIQTLLADSHYHTHFKNTSQAFHYVCMNYGYGELFRGIAPILLRNGPSNVLFFILREEAAANLPKRDDRVTQSVQEFLSGAFIGAFLSTLFYPLNVLKTKMQATLGIPNQSMSEAFRILYAERGSKMRNVYKGCGINGTRAFVSWGIINVSYEGIKRLFF
ncbi:mitochondrial nicotinamide adenine dinucleotide transporter SLC25A51 [Sitodiplosis mosellana]|uniref:mitochondrial nicotinamide adenine dinucleotide transporter SLC25A51 n=1 Tax=Sitodiplosis mosellana TaxID=263140 RepID=UPI002443934B|nr:mitochondrial nicotinamide adenine dinucleotide transporter SLC25A51 [Sitodiplosis mosellana]